MGVWAKIDEIFLGKRGIGVPPDYLDAIAALGFRPAAEYTVRRFGLSETPDELMAEWMEMAVQAYRTDVQTKPYAKEFLLRLKQSGVKLAVATASQETLFVPALKRNGIYDLFDTIVTLKEVSRGKGYPDIYWKAAENLSLSAAECAVFEDIYLGIKGAKDGGFFAVGVEDAYSGYEKETIRAEADCFIYSFSELLGLA